MISNKIWAIINDGAQAIYKGIIPADRWTDPYMSREKLQHEIDDGVVFWGYEESGALAGVMGIQEVQGVTLIRHAYVSHQRQKHGIGGCLLSHLLGLSSRPVLIGTWATAVWAIRFYETNGFQMVSPIRKKTASSENTGKYRSARSKPRWFSQTPSGAKLERNFARTRRAGAQRWGSSRATFPPATRPRAGLMMTDRRKGDPLYDGTLFGRSYPFDHAWMGFT